MKKLAALATGAVLVAACQDTQISGPTSSAVSDLPVPLAELSAEGGCVVPPLGLVSWWPGDLDATDIIGVNHGTQKLTAGFTDGIVGQGFSFDGVGYIVVPDHASLNLTDELTVEFWFKYNAVPSALQGLVAKRGSNAGDTPPTNYGASVGGGLGFLLYYADNVTPERGGDFPTAQFNAAQSLPVPMPAAGAFHHFAGTYKQTDATHVELKIYIDGSLARSILIPGNLGNTLNDDPLIIGASREYLTGGPPGQLVPLEPFVGIIDEVSIYNRALTGDGEIAAIYYAGGAGKCRDGESSEGGMVEFSEFEIDEAEYRSDDEDGGRFEVEGRFVLGAGSDGIDVLNEDVTVAFDSYSLTIPAGAFFRDDDDEGFQYDGDPPGIKRIYLRDDGEFRVKGRDVDLNGIDLTNPVSVSLKIGDDMGQTTILFDDEGEYKLDDDDEELDDDGDSDDDDDDHDRNG